LTEFDEAVRPVLELSKPKKPITPPPSRPEGLLPEQPIGRTDTVEKAPPQNNNSQPEDSDFLDLDILEEQVPTNTTQLFRNNVDMTGKTGILPPLPPIRPRKKDGDEQ